MTKSFSAFITESDLEDAIDDMKSRIEKNGYSKGLENEVADEWDVKAPLLLRMFKQKTGRDPDDYKRTDMTDKLRAVAVKKAKDDAKRYTGGADISGKLFVRDGKEYAAIAWTSSGLHVIQVEDGRPFVISFSNAATAYKMIKKWGIA